MDINPSSTLPIVCIHGRDSSKETFSTLFRDGQLEPFRLIAIDLPGHGDDVLEQEEADEIYASVESFVDRLAAKIDAFLGPESKFVLLGHSMGARACLAYLLRPQLASRVLEFVIEDMDMAKRKPVGWNKEQVDSFTKASQTVVGYSIVESNLAPFYDKDWVKRKFEHGMIRKTEPAADGEADQADETSTYFIGTNPYVTRAAHKLLLVSKLNKPEFVQFCHQKPQPTGISLILASTGSACGKGQRKWFEETYPEITTVMIKDSHHSVHNAQTTEFAKTLCSIAKRAFSRLAK